MFFSIHEGMRNSLRRAQKQEEKNRGRAIGDLQKLMAHPPESSKSFISPLTKTDQEASQLKKAEKKGLQSQERRLLWGKTTY